MSDILKQIKEGDIVWYVPIIFDFEKGMIVEKPVSVQIESIDERWMFLVGGGRISGAVYLSYDEALTEYDKIISSQEQHRIARKYGIEKTPIK